MGTGDASQTRQGTGSLGGIQALQAMKGERSQDGKRRGRARLGPRPAPDGRYLTPGGAALTARNHDRNGAASGHTSPSPGETLTRPLPLEKAKPDMTTAAAEDNPD